MESLEARKLLFKKMNGKSSIHSALVREAISLLNEQREEIEQLKETVRIYKVVDEFVKEQSKKVKHLFPLENTAGYGQLCDKMVEKEKEIEKLKSALSQCRCEECGNELGDSKDFSRGILCRDCSPIIYTDYTVL